MFLDPSRALSPSDRPPSPRRPRGPVRLLGFGVLMLALAGCSKQGEGERCDTLNGSEDCEQGLTCTRLSDFRAGAPGAVCCPVNPTQNVCQNGGLDFLDDAGPTSESTPPPADGGNTDGPTLTEAGADLSSSNVSGTVSDAAASGDAQPDVDQSTETDAASSDISSTPAEMSSSGDSATSSSAGDAGQ